MTSKFYENNINIKKIGEMYELTVKVKLIKLPISSSDFIALSPLTTPPKNTWVGLASLMTTSEKVGGPV